MDIEKLKQLFQNKSSHMVNVNGDVLLHADCMDVLPHIPDKSIQLILADLPYGTTANKWDSILDLNKLWIEYEELLVCKLIIKEQGTQ